MNSEIRAHRVVLVGADGERVGEFMLPDALEFAVQQQLDLIEVAPNANPPICRLGDWGKIKYERQKAASERRKRQSQPSMKEIKVRPKTDDHDIEVKIRNAQRFLERGDRVKIVVFFRGREHAHHDIGAEQCMRIFKGVEAIARIEMPPRMEGRRMQMIIVPDARAVTTSGSDEPEEDEG